MTLDMDRVIVEAAATGAARATIDTQHPPSESWEVLSIETEVVIAGAQAGYSLSIPQVTVRLAQQGSDLRAAGTGSRKCGPGGRGLHGAGRAGARMGAV